MRLPNDDELDEAAELIAGVDFEFLGPEQKAIVINICIKADIAEQLYDMSVDINKHLPNIGAWFDKSRLFEGL